MAKIEIGNNVGVPCSVGVGPFEDEVLVEFDTLDGKVSGFARSKDITVIGGQHYIRGRVVSVERDCVSVMVSGSFFTTNGLAHVSQRSVEALPLAA